LIAAGFDVVDNLSVCHVIGCEAWKGRELIYGIGVFGFLILGSI
jgi:hypothetical protein